jgi:hypothetical protein
MRHGSIGEGRALDNKLPFFFDVVNNSAVIYHIIGNHKSVVFILLVSYLLSLKHGRHQNKFRATF